MSNLRIFGDQTIAKFLLVIPVLSACWDIRFRCLINQSIVLGQKYININICATELVLCKHYRSTKSMNLTANLCSIARH